MSSPFTYHMSSYPSSLQACLQAFEESDAYAIMPPRLRFTAELILDELISNIIKYGGLNCREISVDLTADHESLKLAITDDGNPFNPWLPAVRPMDEPVTDIQSLTIGGRGLEMLRAATDSRHYERTDGKNINILTRSTAAGQQPAAA